MNRTFTRIITLTVFILLIGVFIYYRTGGFEQYLAPDNDTPAANTTVPAGAASNTLAAASPDNSLALASTDTTKPRPADSATLQNALKHRDRRMMSSSKSIVLMEDNERIYNSVKQVRLPQDSLRKKVRYNKVGTPPQHQATKSDTTKPRP